VIDAESGRPIGESVVTLNAATAQPLNPIAAAAAALKVITDANGRFVYRDLPKGRYSITTLKPGYVNGALGKMVPRGPSAPLELADGERVTDVRIIMWKHSAITGRVVDEAGEPVVGVEIRVRRVSMVAGRPGFVSMLTGSITTDDRGMYRVPSLDPGRYVIGVASTSTTLPAAMVDSYFRATGTAKGEMQLALFAAAPTMSSPGSSANQVIGDHILQVENRMPTPPGSLAGESRAIYAATYYPQASRISDATPIEVKGGETRSGIDLSLRAVPTVRISGRLEGPDGGSRNRNRLSGASERRRAHRINDRGHSDDGVRRRGCVHFLGCSARPVRHVHDEVAAQLRSGDVANNRDSGARRNVGPWRRQRWWE
jgi:hypothetical protein